MKVIVKKEHRYKGVTSYYWNGYDPAFCCPEMAHAWKERAIRFGEAESALDELKAVCIHHTDCWPEGAYTHSFPIEFCPFCGMAVEIEVVETDMTPEKYLEQLRSLQRPLVRPNLIRPDGI